MISLQEIGIFSRAFCLKTFEDLFADPKDIISIHNFLLCPYQEAYEQFDIKLKYINVLDEKIFFIYDIGNNLIGYATIFPNRWSQNLFNNEIECGLFIKDGYRNRGYGAEVLKQLEQYIQINMPEVEIIALSPALSNEKAASLYERLGWEYEPNSLALSQDMIYMIKSVKKDTVNTSNIGINYLLESNNINSKIRYIIGHVFAKESRKIGIYQFNKTNNFADYSVISKYIGDINIYRFDILNKDQLYAGWDLLKRSLPSYELIVIDDISKLTSYGLNETQIIELIKTKPSYLDILFACENPSNFLQQDCQFIKIN